MFCMGKVNEIVFVLVKEVVYYRFVWKKYKRIKMFVNWVVGVLGFLRGLVFSVGFVLVLIGIGIFVVVLLGVVGGLFFVIFFGLIVVGKKYDKKMVKY